MSPSKRLCSPMKTQNKVAVKKQKLLHEEQLKGITTKKESPLDNYGSLFDDSWDFGMQDVEAVIAGDPGKDAASTALDLSAWQRCLVKKVDRGRDLVLHVQAASAEKQENVPVTASCHLQGVWSDTRVEVNDLVSLQAVWDAQLNAYKVSKDEGFCITNPDTLISGTTVVGSLFCRRKAVLQDNFKGIDANSKVMVIGSLVHELLQNVLVKGLKTYEQIDAEAQQLLQSRGTAYMLYSNQIKREEVLQEVQKFVPNIAAFMLQYVQGQEPAVLQKDLFQGHITKVQDIEENVWVPQLGLKGKIDVSVRIHRRRNTISSAEKTAIPLELKTGRATFSMEHKGQLILYQMMLSATGRRTDTGLLLYLREGIMREVQSKRNELRDLIMLRNDLSHYLSRLPANDESLSLGEGKFMQPLELPEPISHHSACSSCPYATICCTFAKTDAKLNLRETHPLRKVMQTATAHLQPEDYAYFIHWCALLALEEQEVRKSNHLRSLWTDSPEHRQRKGRAIVGLVLHNDAICEESRYVQTFKMNGVDGDLTLSGFSIGEYVIVSSRNHLAIAAGCICELSESTIAISLERNLHENHAGESFIVDKYDSQSSRGFNFTNLGQLLEDNSRVNALRAIVVQRQQPSYDKLLPKSVATTGAEILQQLNSGQRAAALKALTTTSYMLIKGLPGTGKTQTLLAIVRMLHLMGKSVLITSHTHSAVDNLLLRLLPFGLPMLRLGSGKRTHAQLNACSEGELTKDAHTEQELQSVYSAYSIVGVTCLGVAHSIFLHRQFDYCIVDEATQVLQATVLRPLFYCEKFILVGDPEQLPPLVRSKKARTRGADESLFHRLDSPHATATLTLQYRMNKTITKLANSLTYAGALQCASKEVQLAAIKLQLPTAAKWVQRVLQCHVEQAVFLLDTLDCSERSHDFVLTKSSGACADIEQHFAEEEATALDATSEAKASRGRISQYTNYCEAAVVFHIVHKLLRAGYAADRIGIIAPYRAQVELMRKLAAQHQSCFETQTPALNFAAVEVNTVDQYQGRDKDIILYACTRTGAVTSRDFERVRDAEILEDKRRLTVAITRSKMKLILIGDAACLQQYTPFRSLLAHIPSYCKLQLQDDKQEFHWQALLEELSLVLSG